MTTIAQNPTRCCQPAYGCDCCTKGIRGAYVTISGIVKNDPGTCEDAECGELNGTFYVPFDPGLEGCAGYAKIADSLCSDYPNNGATCSWLLACGVDTVSIYVNIEAFGGSVDHEPYTWALVDEPVTVPVDCATLGGALPNTTSPPPWYYNCDATGASCTIVFDMEA